MQFPSGGVHERARRTLYVRKINWRQAEVLEEGLVEGHGKDVDVRRNVDDNGVEVVVQGPITRGWGSVQRCNGSLKKAQSSK